MQISKIDRILSNRGLHIEKLFCDFYECDRALIREDGRLWYNTTGFNWFAVSDHGRQRFLGWLYENGYLDMPELMKQKPAPQPETMQQPPPIQPRYDVEIALIKERLIALEKGQSSVKSHEVG